MKLKKYIGIVALIFVFMVCGIIIRNNSTDSLQSIIKNCNIKTDFYCTWFMPLEEVHPNTSFEERRKIWLECAVADYCGEIFFPIEYFVLKRGTFEDWLNYHYRTLDRIIYGENSSCNYASRIKSLMY